LRPEFWALGHKLFNSTDETVPVKFIPGDVFDSNFLPLTPPAYEETKIASPDFGAKMDSLNPLIHKINLIHTASFFHLFNQEEQMNLAQLLAGLLSPKPGSMIFGSHRGNTISTTGTNPLGGVRFEHSPESWNEMWNETIFRKGTVQCTSCIRTEERRDLTNPEEPVRMTTLLVWSVKRL